MDKKSESYALLRFIWGLIKLPFILILALFGKRKANDILAPFKNIITDILAPRFTITLIGINIAIFIASIFIPDQTLNTLLFYPADVFSAKAYTLITSGFLHANTAHLLGNMLALYVFGRVVELEIGKGKTALIYFSAMILGGLFYSLTDILIFQTGYPALGASGAVMGMVATAILLKPFTFVYEFIIPLPVFILGWLTILADITGLLSSADDGIAHFAHIGGFLAIFALMPFIEEKNKLWKGLLMNLGVLILAVLVYFIFLR